MNKLILYVLLLLFIAGIFINVVSFESAHVSPPPFGWYQQFMPNLNGRSIVDITFTDSLTGYTITNRLSTTDTSFIFKTTNGGDNWFRSYSDSGVIYDRIQFINQNTGFVGGYIYKNNSFWFVKTTNRGTNWFYINAPFDFAVIDMFALNQDTIWVVDDNQLVGGVFRTTNGGQNWTQQYYNIIGNPDRIYMFNARIGFISEYQTNSSFYRTTNGGTNWSLLLNNESFDDIFFIDSLTGWKSGMGFKITSNGGLNWTTQTFPQGIEFLATGINKFSVINKDTLFGVGAILITPTGNRAIIYRTTNSGTNWLYQLPDTSIHIFQYAHINFVNKLNGWAYSYNQGGVHTVTGGDTLWYTGIVQQSKEVPKDFILKQNYPNPFNPRTVIPYNLKSAGYVRIIAYDILGREVQKLVDQKQSAGEYEVDFMGKFTATGVYFYRMAVDGKVIGTKTMVLLK
jgi:photosystem II stability/assembly factor-like uncharacterized protein